MEHDAEVLVLGGPVIRDTLVRYGPFVANSHEHMAETVRAYQSGSFGEIAAP